MGVVGPAVADPVTLRERAVQQDVVGVGFAQRTQQAGRAIGEQRTSPSAPNQTEAQVGFRVMRRGAVSSIPGPAQAPPEGVNICCWYNS